MTSRPTPCPHCGDLNDPGAQFCARCGGPLPLPLPPAAGPDAPLPPGVRPPRRRPVADPAPAASSVDAVYRGHRLTYPPGVTDLDPIDNREYLRVMAVRALVFWAVWLLGSLLLFLLFGIAGIAQLTSDVSATIDDYGEVQTTGSESGVLLSLWFILSLVWTVGLWAFFWFTRIPVLLSEWMLTVDGGAGLARVALDHMQEEVRSRQPPLDGFTVVQVAPQRRTPRLYLQLVDGSYRGFISSFPVGSDLFLGWTFWLSQSPFRWIWAVLVRAVRAVTLRASALHDSLGSDDAKALREVMHSVVRDAVDVAHAAVAGADPHAVDGR